MSALTLDADDLLLADVQCQHLTHTPDTTAGIPCGWSGTRIVAVFHDTREIIWECDEGHENYETWSDYFPVTKELAESVLKNVTDAALTAARRLLSA
jgi:hypothetical protein